MFSAPEKAKFKDQSISSFAGSVKSLKWDKKKKEWVVHLDVPEDKCQIHGEEGRHSTVIFDFNASQFKPGQRVIFNFKMEEKLIGNLANLRLVTVDEYNEVINEISEVLPGKKTWTWKARRVS